ncbi:RAQPRD family integrative conjugative element protein [Pseudomonas sp. SIMBA_059]
MSNLYKFLAAVAFTACCSAPSAFARPAGDENQQLTFILRQLDAANRLSTAHNDAVIDPNARYTFDYARLSADIDVIRQGIDVYLTPSRAQPRNPAELTGHYVRSEQTQP